MQPSPATQRSPLPHGGGDNPFSTMIAPAVVSGALGGLFTAIPIIGLLNYCFGFFVVLSVTLGLSWYRKRMGTQTLSLGEGAAFGAICGATLGIVSGILGLIIQLIIGSMLALLINKYFPMFFPTLSKLIPKLVSTVAPTSAKSSALALQMILTQVVNFLWPIALYTACGAIIGLVYLLFFQKQPRE